jgi:hypothetical protein
VSSIGKSNAAAILKEAVVILEGQRKAIAHLPKGEDISMLPRMSEMEELLTAEITHKHEIHTNGVYMLQALYRKLR